MFLSSSQNSILHRSDLLSPAHLQQDPARFSVGWFSLILFFFKFHLTLSARALYLSCLDLCLFFSQVLSLLKSKAFARNPPLVNLEEIVITITT